MSWRLAINDLAQQGALDVAKSVSLSLLQIAALILTLRHSQFIIPHEP